MAYQDKNSTYFELRQASAAKTDETLVSVLSAALVRRVDQNLLSGFGSFGSFWQQVSGYFVRSERQEQHVFMVVVLQNL